MEVLNHTAQREDRSLIVVMHLTQLLTYVTGFGGLIVPLILWLTQRDKVMDMDDHGKAAINFQLSLILITIICIPGILLFGLGILGFIFVGIVGFVLPIVNAIRASNGQEPSYFSTIRFIK
ncbi:MAG: DUF4870 domain-containing protein [Flavobacteriaceae bacterium]|nr:DUF4870 domain-containing protein [Flavobacteriaceae bacterium]